MNNSKGLRAITSALSAIVVAILLISSAPFSQPGTARAQSDSPDVELARKYAPVVYMREEIECDPGSEQYLPAPVESVFEDSQVELRQIAGAGTPSDPVVMRAPKATDLDGLDDQYYLNFPGNSRQPGCDYQQWFDVNFTSRNLPIAIYARVATDPDAPGMLALQYWFYWVYNQFNNLHESDWEMVQLNFEANDAAEALSTDPLEVAFAQHGGGERADWGDEKIELDGTRLVVYPAAGSHASYYTDALWIGWGRNGSGFGCDDAREPLTRADPVVMMMPEHPDPNGEFAWLLFDGRWGQRQDWEFNGPLGPNAGNKWDSAITWTEGIRDNSLAVPGHTSIGTGSTEFFCSISRVGGGAMALLPFDPRIFGVLTTLVVLVLVMLAFFGWRYLLKAIPLYFRNLHIFLPISLLLIVVALAGNALEDIVRRISLLNSGLDSISSSALTSTVLGLGFSSIQQLLLFSLIGPAVIHATFDLVRKDKISARESWNVATQEFPTTLGAILLNALLSLLMVISIILIPLALYRAIQWLYTPHAVIIQGASLRSARHVSRHIVKGHWIRTLGMALLIAMVAGLPGPIIGMAAFIVGDVSMNWADAISSGIYAIAYPIAVIASTLYYLTIGGYDTQIDERIAQESRPEPSAVQPAPA